MSKVIKQMEMDALKKAFGEVRDVVVLSVSKLSSTGEDALRTALNKKKVRLKVVKNSLTRRVFGELGFGVPDDSPFWSGPTMLAFGSAGVSIAEISRAVEAEVQKGKTAVRYRDRVTVKGAIADGQPVTFEAATKMPTRLEALGQILGMILSPGSDIAGCLVGPGGQVASQIESKSKEEEGAPAEAATT